MRRPSRPLPEPPDMPTFRVEGDAPIPAQERHVDTGLVRHRVALDVSRIDEDASRVVHRLEKAGFEAYLVGGCVRDILLSRTPKDFDVATSARPEDVRAIFRNCRIIGRRFRLAHILFGQGKVVEVATFRKNPEAVDESLDQELIIRNDNVFGEAHEDAIRRDFTINALFYDVERACVLDWCGGMRDIQERTIRVIGDPSVRFREDPVRMLRAIKFASRLDLGIEPHVIDAMVLHREDLAKAAKARVFEEILRLLRAGGAARAMWLLWELGAMSVLVPELSSFLDDQGDGALGYRFFARLRAMDAHVKEHGNVDDIVMLAILFFEPLLEELRGVRDIERETIAFFEPLIQRLSMPRRHAEGVAKLISLLPRIAKNKGLEAIRPDRLGPALFVMEFDAIAKGRDGSVFARKRAQLSPTDHEVAPRRVGQRRGRRRPLF